MNYQKSNDLLNPILHILNNNEYHLLDDIVLELAKIFDLDEEFLNQRYEISNAKIFQNTVQWKINDLHKSGLIEFIKKGSKRAFIISLKGKSFLDIGNDEISRYIRDNYYKSPKPEKNEEITETQIKNEQLLDNETPLALLDKAEKILRQQIYDEILDTILTKSPAAFERLVSDLLQKMGYGDGEVTQLSRDGGIDASVKGDVLGFEQIYVQAKRYKDTVVSRPDIQQFVGAVSNEGNMTKGVFITTSKFSKDAREYAQSYRNARIVLIDGLQLAKYMYDYELGVQNEKTFSIKKLDNDFWEAVEND